MSAHAVRVAVIVGADRPRLLPQLSDCALDVVAELPAIADVLEAPSHDYEAALVGCTRAQLTDARFRSQLARLARTIPTVLVVPRLTRAATAVAACARLPGLAVGDTTAEELTYTVRSVVRGHVAYPPGALNVLLHLGQPVRSRDLP